jgi:ribosomal protein S27AE
MNTDVESEGNPPTTPSATDVDDRGGNGCADGDSAKVVQDRIGGTKERVAEDGPRHGDGARVRRRRSTADERRAQKRRYQRLWRAKQARRKKLDKAGRQRQKAERAKKLAAMTEEQREALRSIKREAAKRLYRQNKERALIYQKGYEIVNPEKSASHKEVRRALQNGTLKRPSSCSECGRGKCRIAAHHPDYSQPLAVEWLCGSCHQKRHPQKTGRGSSNKRRRALWDHIMALLAGRQNDAPVK